ncbi:MAG: tetratricopeptide repeat protein [Bacteroidota bacterium]
MRSIDIGKEALILAINNNDKQQIAKSYFLVAYYQSEKGMYYQALNNYFSALYAYRDAGNYGRQVGTLKNIGVIYSRGGLNGEAISIYKDAKDIAVDLNDIQRMRSIQYHMARSYRFMKDYDRAFEMYLDLVEQNDDFTDKKLLLDCYLELGYITSYNYKDYEKAIEYYQKAAGVYALGEEGYESGRVKGINGIAYCEMYLTNYIKAKNLFYESLAIFDNLKGDKETLVMLYGNLGQLYQKTGDLDSSIIMFENGLRVEPLQNFDKTYIQTAEHIYNYYRKKSPQKREYYHQIIYKYGLELSELKLQLTKASHEYQVRAADYRRELDLRIARERRMFWWDVFFYGLSLIILATGATYYFLEKKKRRKRLRKALDNARIVVPLPGKY